MDVTCSKCGKVVDGRSPICTTCGNSLQYEKMMQQKEISKGGGPMVCTNCGSKMIPKRDSPCSLIILILLCLLGFIPGIIYLVYCISKTTKKCSACGSESIVPVHSPIGQEIINSRAAD